MFEFLRDMGAMLFRGREGGGLPDCKAILFRIKADYRLDPRSATRFVALCRLTAIAIALRWISIGLLLCTAMLLYLRAQAVREIAITAALGGASIVVFGMVSKLTAFLASDYLPNRRGAGMGIEDGGAGC